MGNGDVPRRTPDAIPPRNPPDARGTDRGQPAAQPWTRTQPPAAAPGPTAEQDRAGRDAEKDKKKDKKDRKDKKKKMSGIGSARGIETMFRTSYRTHLDMSALADTKANIMISINGIIVSVLLASISPRIDANPWLLIPTSVLLVTCLISLVFAVLSARPRVSRRSLTLEDVRQKSSNILFFGNFVSLSESDYLTGMTELLQNPDRLYTNMLRDIYSLGSVLERKFRLLRTSYTVFMFGLITGVILFLIVYLSVVFAGPRPATVL